MGNFLGILASIPGTVIAIIMLVTVSQAGKGGVVSGNTVKAIGLAGIIVSILMFLSLLSIIGGISLLIASIMFRLSIKNFQLARAGVLISGFGMIFTVAVIAKTIVA